MAWMKQIKEILMNRGVIKPSIILVPDNVEFVHKDFLNGYFLQVRPLHTLDIAIFTIILKII